MKTVELAAKFDRIMEILGSEQCHRHVPMEVRRLVVELSSVNRALLGPHQLPVLEQMVTQLERAIAEVDRHPA